MSNVEKSPVFACCITHTRKTLKAFKSYAYVPIKQYSDRNMRNENAKYGLKAKTLELF